MPSVFQSLLQEFEDMFQDKEIPPIRGTEHKIDVIPRTVISYKPAYRVNPTEIKEIKRQVEELMEKGYVRESLSPCSIRDLLVPKKDEPWRICMDNRVINKITVKCRHPIPRLDDMLDLLHDSCLFIKIILKSRHHQIRMHVGDEWKTTFNIKFGLYEWLVMPFRLTNAPSKPMRLIYNVLRKYMRKHVVVYIDDIIIYLKILLKHVEHVKLVLITHRKEKFNFSKGSFCMEKVHSIGFIVGKNRVALDRDKVKFIMDLPTPKSARKFRSSHELANLYKRFINEFRTITQLLNDLVKKNASNFVFKWG